MPAAPTVRPARTPGFLRWPVGPRRPQRCGCPAYSVGTAHLEFRDHLQIDDAVGRHIGDGTFQAIADGDEDLSLAVAGLGRERQDDAVVEFGIADAPFLAHAHGKLKGLLAAEVGVGHHDDAVGRRVVEGADGLVELRFVLGRRMSA